MKLAPNWAQGELASIADNILPGGSVVLGWFRNIFGRRRPEVAYVVEMNLAGVTMTNANGMSRQKVIAGCQPGEPLLIVRERHNRHDANAVAVKRANGTMVGYIPRQCARELAAAMDAGVAMQGRIVAMTGGEEDKPTLGIVVRVLALKGS